MLISFKVSNFKSILEPICLNMLADPEDHALLQYLYEIEGIDEKVNSFSVIMGANGSGKSSIIDALKFVREVALRKGVETIPRNRLAPKDMLSVFEVCYQGEQFIEKYVLKVASSGTVHETVGRLKNGEWEETFDGDFEYKKDDTGIPSNELNVDWVKEAAYTVDDWGDDSIFDISFFRNLNFFNAIDNDIDLFQSEDLNGSSHYKVQKLSADRRSLVRIDYDQDQNKFKEALVSLLNNFGVNVKDVEFEKLGATTHHFEGYGDFMYTSAQNISSSEQIVDDARIEITKANGFNPNEIPYDYDSSDYVTSDVYCLESLVYESYSVPIVEESSGTKRLTKLAFRLLMLASHYQNFTFVLDEMDAGLHDVLSAEIVKQFFVLCRKSYGTKQSQLIISSHNTVLLRDIPLRKDQLWFTEMKENRTTDLFSLADLKGVKASENFAENYLRGKYGALPPKKEWMKEPNKDGE